MAILIDKNTRVVVQGITGSAGRFHTARCIEYGTQVVAGCTPNRGGETFESVDANGKKVSVPIFDTVKEAVRQTGADVACIFVPAPAAADAVLEAAFAGCRVVVCITEHVPVLDMLRTRRALDELDTVLIGPNCPGIITPGACKIGIMPGHIHRPGRFGVVSRSGTLTYEGVGQLSSLGMGQSTSVGIGGDPVGGADFVEILKLFNEDPETDGVLMMGEIGGNAEERAAAYIKAHMTKPVAAFIAGSTAPPGKRMGHAGAIISGGAGTAAQKVAVLRDAGVAVADSPAVMGETLKRLVG